MDSIKSSRCNTEKMHNEFLLVEKSFDVSVNPGSWCVIKIEFKQECDFKSKVSLMKKYFTNSLPPKFGYISHTEIYIVYTPDAYPYGGIYSKIMCEYGEGLYLIKIIEFVNVFTLASYFAWKQFLHERCDGLRLEHENWLNLMKGEIDEYYSNVEGCTSQDRYGTFIREKEGKITGSSDKLNFETIEAFIQKFMN